MKLGGGVSQGLLKVHNAVFNAHENALKALFSRDSGLAESIRNERGKVKGLIREVETLAKKEQDVNIIGIVVSALETLGRIYELSVDLADLVMPKLEL